MFSKNDYTEQHTTKRVMSAQECIDKFHPELAAVEYTWGEAKRWTRRHCDYSLAGLRLEVPIALASVRISTIRRHFAHVERYMIAYAHPRRLTSTQVEWSMRKFTSHRRLKGSDVKALEQDFLTPQFFADMPKKYVDDTHKVLEAPVKAPNAGDYEDEE